MFVYENLQNVNITNIQNQKLVDCQLQFAAAAVAVSVGSTEQPHCKQVQINNWRITNGLSVWSAPRHGHWTHLFILLHFQMVYCRIYYYSIY